MTIDLSCETMTLWPRGERYHSNVECLKGSKDTCSPPISKGGNHDEEA